MEGLVTAEFSYAACLFGGGEWAPSRSAGGIVWEEVGRHCDAEGG